MHARTRPGPGWAALLAVCAGCASGIVPATVRGTGDGRGIGVLRIDFPGGAGEDQLEHVPWEDWLSTFDDSGLALLYQEHKANGEDSTFAKLVRR